MYTGFTNGRADYLAWLEAIKHTHQRRVVVRVLDLEHNVISSNMAVIDGQLSIDVTRETPRVVNLTLLDRTRSIGWGPDTAANVPIHMRRMVQVLDQRAIPGVGWRSCPVFTGPVADFDRDGAVVSLVCEGKERLALGNFGRSYSWPKGRRVVDVIRAILAITGETESRVHLPASKARIPETLNVTRMDQPWRIVRRLASSLGCVIFYDGRGHVVMRKAPSRSSLKIDSDALAGPVRFDHEAREVRNRWSVLGAKPKGAKSRVGATVDLPASHALSASKLGRNGKPRFLIDEHEDSQIKTTARARIVALLRRDEQMRGTSQVSFECLPFPHVEEYDLVSAVDPLAGAYTARIHQATLPLMGGAMSIGYLKRVALVKKRKGAKR